MSVPAGYVTFTYAATWPDIEGNSTGPVSYPPQGTLLNFGNTYQSSDPTQGPIDKALQAAVWLKTQLYGAGQPSTPLFVLAHPGALTRAIPPIFENDPAGGNTLAMGPTSVGSTKVANQVFLPPQGATLTKCTLYVAPGNSTPPAGVKVKGVIYRVALAGGTITTIGTTTDPATGTSYGAPHSFDALITAGNAPGNATAELIDQAVNTYYLQLVGETGSGAANCAWTGSTQTYTL